MSEDTEFTKLPLQQRCTHKLWKARVHGFTEVLKLFQEEEDDKAAVFNTYAGLLSKFVGDTNVAAQEKGLEATLYFVQNSAIGGKTVKDVMPVIVGKSIGANKKTIQDLSSQIALMYIEVEKQDVVVEELVKGLEHKNPKIISACLSTLTAALKEFGAQVVGIKSLVKSALALLENRDKTVRDEAKLLITEIYRWIGEAIKPQLVKLQPIQMSELETEFVKVKGAKAVPTRYLRSQQAKQAKVAAAKAVAGGNDVENCAVEVEIDPLSLVDPINILAKIPSDFYEKLEAKKWQERKEALEGLEKILDYPKFEKGDYGDLVRALLKVISKDSNVVVVGVATKCLARLVSGLKKGFQPYALVALPQLLSKFKEKKMNVVTPLREAVDAIYSIVNLEAIIDDITASLDSKNPSIKSETAGFLARIFALCTPANLNKKILKTLCTSLHKTLNESDPVVRDSSAEALGVAMKVVGEKVVVPFLPDLDPLKLVKIKEFHDKAVVKTVAPVRVAPAPVVEAIPSPKAENVPKKVLSGGAAKAHVAKVQKLQPIPPPDTELTMEEVEEKAASYMSEDVIKGLCSTEWKTRLEKMEVFLDTVTSMEQNAITAEVMSRILARKPGLRDNNFQVLKLKLDSLKFLAENFPMSKSVVDLVIADVTEKLGDPKNGTLAGETLMVLAEAANLDIVGSCVLGFAFSQKSVKIQQEAMDWMGEAVQNFGLIINTNTLITFVKKGLNSVNLAVRLSSAGLAGILSMYLGQNLLKLLDEKPAAVALVNAELEKRAGEEPLEPCRTCKIGSKEAGSRSKSAPVQQAIKEDTPPTEDDEEEIMDEPVKGEKQKPPPRIDISTKISEQLLAELGDKNWKVRNEALITLQSIVSDAKAIKANLGELPPILSLRFGDSNGKLSVTALEICSALAVALGPGAKTQVRNFARAIFTALGDNKPPVRAAALTCINAWAAEAGAKEFFLGEVIPDALKSSSSSLKIEVWNWLGEVMPTVKGLPKDELSLMIPFLFAGLEDRNAEVRKAANSAVLGMMMHLGYGNMAKEVDKLKPASKAGIMQTLDKVRPDLPEATPTVKSKPESAKPKSAGPKSIKSSRQIIVPAPAKATSRKKEDDVDTSPLLPINKMKTQRMLDEMKLKTLKWNFTSPRSEFVELLQDQTTTAGFNKTLITNMFHNDFKYHLKALESLTENINDEEAVIANLDLILKWLTLRFFDTNPSVLLKGLEYLQTVFTMLIEREYTLSEVEVNSFIPYLVIKIGDPKDAVRERVHAIIRQFSLMYAPSKLFSLIMEGLKSKNSRQRTECLEEISYLIEQFGTSVCLPSPAVALKEISKQIADRDNAVRSAALNAIVKAYFVDGDKIYKMIGQLSDKDMSYLEERIKRASQNRVRVQREEKTMISKDESRMPEPEPEVEEELQEEYIEPKVDQKSPDTTSRAKLSPFKVPERPVRRFPKLDLVEIDVSFLDEPLHIPESVLKKMENAAPKSPALMATLRDVSSLNLDSAYQGLKNLFVAITNPDNGNSLAKYAKDMYSAVIAQLKACNTYSTATHGLVLGQVYKVLLRVIGEMFEKQSLAKAADENDLKMLTQELIIAFVEDKTVGFQDGGFNQYIIMFLSKMLTAADLTSVTCAIINALHDLVGNPPQNPKVTELTIKCLIKVVTHVKKAPNIDSAINLDKVLLTCHNFTQAYPRYTWKDRPSDLPLKAVKTLLLHLVQKKGSDIMLNLRGIENSLSSELAAILKKIIASQPSGTSSKLTKPMSDHLAEVFMKIGSEATMKEGIIEFYEFKRRHPDVDLTQIMSATSQYFQDYVNESLKEIEKERGPLRCTVTSTTSAKSSSRSVKSADPPADPAMLPQHYLNVLRSYQERLGMPITNIPGLEPYDTNSNL